MRRRVPVDQVLTSAERGAKGKGHPIPYSDQELRWLEKHRPLLSIRDLHVQFCELFGRDVSADALHALCIRKGWLTGRTGQFVKGSVPSNKGKRCPPGIGGNHENARRTQFRPGERRGIAVEIYKPIGTERLSKDGFVERKIHDGLPLQSRWRGVHMIRWEALHGLVPDGMALKCLDGDRTNTEPSNWECVSRAVILRLNNNRRRRRLDYDDASPELRPMVLAVAKVAVKVREVRKEQPE